MAKATISQPLAGTNTWFVLFATIDTFLLLIFPGISKLILLINFLHLEWFNNPLSKILFAFFGVYSLGGFWFLYAKIKEYYEEAFIPFQRGKYMAKPPQKPMTMKLGIPVGFEYDPTIFIGFFFFMGNAFKTTNANKQSQYNYGRWFSNVTFDQIIHEGQITTYMTFPTKKYNEVVEMYKRFFPMISLELSDDPYKTWPKTWDLKKGALGYDRVVGFNLGNANSSTFPLPDAGDLNPQNMPMDMLMRALRDTFPDEIFVFQNIFRFNPGNWGGNPDSEYHKEFEKWRNDKLKEYAPQVNGKMDTHAFESFLPEWASKSISKIAYHLNCMYPAYTFRIMALCKDENDEIVYQKLEKLCRVYGGNTFDDSNNQVDVMYLTSTHQEYKNEKSAGNRKFQGIYDTFVFPDWFGPQFEAMAAPWYEKYYYPNENKYRMQVIYKTTVKRDLNAPWNGDWNLTEAFGMSGFFQFPSKSTEPNRIEVLTSGDLQTYKGVWRNDYTAGDNKTSLSEFKLKKQLSELKTDEK
jgi:hypothetical protein